MVFNFLIFTREAMNHMKTFRGRLTSFLVHEKFQVAVETLDETAGKQSLTSISK